MKERIVIVLIAIVLGLAFTTVGFFIYQSTKVLPEDTKPKSANSTNTTPAPDDSFFVRIEQPADEAIVDRRSLDIKGTTNPENIILISSNQEDIVARPTRDGKFSVKLAIDAGTNMVVTRVINQQGEEKMDQRIVTFSTEEF